ncbi:FecR family protein [Flavitalea sp.]|nr:FecR domain-containing protein [Flavitalea sp.]
MSNNRFLELISRKLSGEATTEELGEIEEILSADAEASARFKLLHQYWNQRTNANQLSVEEAFEKLKAKLDAPINETPEKSNRPDKNLLFGVAAAASVILITGSLLFIKKNTGKDESTVQQSALIEKKNIKGVKSTMALPDGTKIWLNADTKIQYPKKFSGSTREVYLSGEAFFEVAKNPGKPFIIHLANGTVKVLGTSFNIRAYENEKFIETSVATGKVAFIPKPAIGRKQDTVFLTGDKKLRYLFTKEQAIVESTISKEDMAWIGGKLVFRGMSFDEIGVELERTFGKKIVFLSESARQFRLTGSFQNNSLEEILFYLSKSTEFSYKINNEEVLISDGSKELPQRVP